MGRVRAALVVGALVFGSAVPGRSEPAPFDLAATVSAFCSPDPATRRKAVLDLPPYPAGAHAVRLLQELTHDEDEAVRAAATDGLRSYLDPAFVEVAAVLGEIAEPPGTPGFLDVLVALGRGIAPSDIAHGFLKGARVEAALGAGFSAFPPDSSFPILLEWLLDVDRPEVRRAAAAVIAFQAVARDTTPSSSSDVERAETLLRIHLAKTVTRESLFGRERRSAVRILLSFSPAIREANVSAIAALAPVDSGARSVLGYWARTSELARVALVALPALAGYAAYEAEALATTREGRRALTGWLRGEDAERRLAAAERLVRVSPVDPAVWPVLAEGLRGAKPESTLEALGKAGPVARDLRSVVETLGKEPPSPPTADPLARPLRQDEISGWAAWAVFRVDPQAEGARRRAAEAVATRVAALRTSPWSGHVGDFLHTLLTHPDSVREFAPELLTILDLPPGEWGVDQPCVLLLETLAETGSLDEVQVARLAKRAFAEVEAVKVHRKGFVGREATLDGRFTLLREERYVYERAFNPRIANALVRVLVSSAKPSADVDRALVVYDGIADHVGRVLAARARRLIGARAPRPPR